jgi:CheY-like chemotaxis protein
MNMRHHSQDTVGMPACVALTPAAGSDRMLADADSPFETMPMNSPRRIVVVDDDSKARLLLERAFAAPEFEIHAFPTGAAALQRISAIRPDCVVSDVLMPDMDGERLLVAVRALPGLERVPFVVVSAVRSESRVQALLAAGADAFLPKPFPLADLIEKVRALLEEPRVTRPVPLAAPGARTEARLASDGDGGCVDLSPPEEGLGRYTRVVSRGRAFVVLTEAIDGPKFTVVTIVTEKGVPLRKLESVLPHPLARKEDRETIRYQVNLQHEDVLARLEYFVLGSASRSVVWPEGSRSVDAGVLAWALSAVAQLAEMRTGTSETARQLARTRRTALLEDAALRVFQVTPAARVVVDEHTGRMPRRTVRAVAGWCRAFATATLDDEIERIEEPVLRATRFHAAELDRVGFYDRLLARAKA